MYLLCPRGLHSKGGERLEVRFRELVREQRHRVVVLPKTQTADEPIQARREIPAYLDVRQHGRGAVVPMQVVEGRLLVELLPGSKFGLRHDALQFPDGPPQAQGQDVPEADLAR